MENIDLGIIEISFLLLSILCISLWKAILVQRQITNYPYAQGFAIFSIIQWVAIGMAFVSELGWGYGIAGLVIVMTIGQAVIGLALSRIWLKLSEDNYLLPTAIFTINV